MWAFLDFVARLILLSGVALVWFYIRSITREPSARVCVCCGLLLQNFDMVSCADCLAVSNVR